MNHSSFEEIIRLQFNALIMITIKGVVYHRWKKLERYSEREILFCEMPEIKQNEYGNNDTYFCDYILFQVLHFTIRVSNEKLGTALEKLSDRQRNYILLYYFQDMNNREIAELYHISRSSVSYTRNRGLKKLKMLLNERN